MTGPIYQLSVSAKNGISTTPLPRAGSDTCLTPCWASSDT